MRRIRPENRRASETFEVVHDQQIYSVSLGMLPDRCTGIEVFVSAQKTASMLEALARDGAILMSFALQYGAGAAELAAAMSRGDKEEPSSLLGAVLDAVVQRGANHAG